MFMWKNYIKIFYCGTIVYFKNTRNENIQRNYKDKSWKSTKTKCFFSYRTDQFWENKLGKKLELVIGTPLGSPVDPEVKRSLLSHWAYVLALIYYFLLIFVN